MMGGAIASTTKDYSLPLYARPQRELTEEEIASAISDAESNWNKKADCFNQWCELDFGERAICLARAIETKVIQARNE